MTTNNPGAQPDGVVEVELLPCPFCGGQAKWFSHFGSPYYTVACGHCGADKEDDSLAEAVRKWNTRVEALTPAPNSIAEQARRAVAAIIESSPWMRQFEVTPKERERLAAIITTEFGAGGGNS